MKELNLNRKIDSLGRIVLPKEYRKCLNIQSGDSIDMYLSENCIVLKKHDLSLDYEEIIRSLLILNRGNEYSDYSITNEDIMLLKGVLNNFIDKILKK